MAKKEKEDATMKVANIFSKMWNPLRNLSRPEIERMIRNSEHGDDVRLQIAYSEIEKRSSIYSVCVKKRSAGILGREWDIRAIDENDADAVKQAEEVKKMF